MSITVSEIVKTYGNQNALAGVSFSIPSGQVVGFLGPNGAGKSTMMKILTGYIPQSAGSALVCGFDVSTHALEVQKRVGYLPEHNPLYLDMYVKEYLAFVAGSFGVSKANINAVIERTGISTESHKKLGALSKGYRQRVGLAAALIHDPEVLILDEPTTGLDPNQLVEIRALIKEIGKEKTVILSTHIMQEVEDMCSRVIIINKGIIVKDQPIEELKNDKSKTTVSITFSSEVEIHKLESLEHVLDVKQVGPESYNLSTNDSDACKKVLFSFAVKHDISISEIKESTLNLESIFQELTK